MSVQGFGAPAPERRRTLRTRLDEIAYVDMGPGNGGVVLNVSEGGLAFCAAIPIQQPGLIQFSLLVKGKGRVASSASVVWTDKKRRTCGLRFAPSFEHSGVLLRHWTDPTYCPSRTWDGTSVSSTLVETRTIPADANKSVTVPVAVATPAGARSTAPISQPERDPFNLITAEDLAAMPQRTSPAAAFVLCVTAAIFLVFGLVLGGYTYGIRAEDSRLETAVRPDADAALQSGVDGVQSAASQPGQTEVTAAVEYLRPPGPPDTTSATRLLQAALKRGNSSAGIFLSQMYLSGEGVRKNCTDARALLTAASKNGSLEASVKLKELVVKGCR